GARGSVPEELDAILGRPGASAAAAPARCGRQGPALRRLGAAAGVVALLACGALAAAGRVRPRAEASREERFVQAEEERDPFAVALGFKKNGAPPPSDPPAGGPPAGGAPAGGAPRA
ncbi:unnamed protein product, partial [Prorocentrum cordatum]